MLWVAASPVINLYLHCSLKKAQPVCFGNIVTREKREVYFIRTRGYTGCDRVIECAWQGVCPLVKDWLSSGTFWKRFSIVSEVLEFFDSARIWKWWRYKFIFWAIPEIWVWGVHEINVHTEVAIYKVCLVCILLLHVRSHFTFPLSAFLLAVSTVLWILIFYCNLLFTCCQRYCPLTGFMGVFEDSGAGCIGEWLRH